MSEWKECRLTEVCDTISETYKDSAKKVVLINTSDVLEGKITNHKFVDNKNLAGQFKKKFQKNDILYSEIRPANKRYAFVDIDPRDYIASTKLMVLRSKSFILPKYLYYLLTNKNTIRELHAIAVGRSGTFPQITYSELSNIKFKLPPIEIQEIILSFLLNLDDKISVNKKICENLEAQAQVLFKHWFIDFAPFKDGKFVESELGMIPEGWRVGTLGEIAELRKPSIKPQNGIIYSHYSIPAYDNNKKPALDEGATIKSNKFGINDGAVLLSKLNPSTKRIWYIGNVQKNSVSSTEFLPFYAKNKSFAPFIYGYLNCEKNYREIANGAKGTTNSHQRIDANSILERKLVYSEEAIADYCFNCQDMLTQV
ncbi:MAG: restriction endonuclease subunit S [Alloprevotella sp.]